MIRSVRVLVIVGLILVGLSAGQLWNGNYRLQGYCNPVLCCCRTGILTISHKSNLLTISSNLVGCQASSSSLSFPFRGGYRLQYNATANQVVTYEISYDSSTIMITNNWHTYCFDVAIRSPSRNSSTLMRSDWSLFVILLSLAKVFIP